MARLFCILILATLAFAQFVPTSAAIDTVSANGNLKVTASRLPAKDKLDRKILSVNIFG
jgi:hypothetical protein